MHFYTAFAFLNHAKQLTAGRVGIGSEIRRIHEVLHFVFDTFMFLKTKVIFL